MSYVYTARRLTSFCSLAALAHSGNTSCEPAPANLVALKKDEVAIRAKWEADESGWTKLPPRAWPANQPPAEAVPGLRQALAQCEADHGKRNQRCHAAKFDLATSLVFSYTDPPEGYALYSALAEDSYGDGLVAQALVLVEGLGVPTDEERGVALLRRAERAGNAQAQYELGVALYTGEVPCVLEDEPAAFAMFLKAAEQGHAGASFMVGDCLIDGCGCDRDLAAAVPWTFAAAEQGHRAARSRMTAMWRDMGRSNPEDGFTDSSRLSPNSHRIVDLGTLPTGSHGSADADAAAASK